MKKAKFRYAIMIIVILAMAVTSCGEPDEPTISNPPENEEPNEDSIPSSLIAESIRLDVMVLDYMPAPGQFVNEIPEYELGDTREIMNAKASKSLCDGNVISLGAWGGYVTIKLSQTLPNIEGKADFRIVGNGVYANDASNAIRIGSSEPGIVLVMRDENENGKDDDTWYELQGNQTMNGIANYKVTYFCPAESATDNEYIAWSANNGDNGWLNRTAEHQQDYFPKWIDNITSMTFEGRRLPNNGSFNSTTNRFDLACYDGYADSHPNNVEASCLDIDDAIDAMGNSVTLSSIDFIKVYTGVLQANGPLGECSTEVAAIEQIVYK